MPPIRKRAALGPVTSLDPTKRALGQNPRRHARQRDNEQICAGSEVVARRVLKNPRLKLIWPRLEKNFDLDPYTFGQGVAQLTTSPKPRPTRAAQRLRDYVWIDKARARPARSRPIGDSLRRGCSLAKRGQPLAGHCGFVTDGANNQRFPAARGPPRWLRAEGVAALHLRRRPSRPPRDIIVANLFAPDVTFVSDEVNREMCVCGSQGLSGQFRAG